MAKWLRPIYRALITSTLMIVTTAAVAGSSTSDLAREKRWAEQTVDDIFVGEPLWLINPNNQIKFLAVYTKPETPSKVGVVLLHGLGVHPTWDKVNRLRVDIAKAGWHTLSIQLPILAADAKAKAYVKTFPEAFERIDVAIGFLKKRGITGIHFIGHSLGGTTGIAYLGERRKTKIQSMISLGADDIPSKFSYTSPQKSLRDIRRPVLDIVGEEDTDSVLRNAVLRLKAARAIGNKGYQQTRIPGADHFYSGRYDLLKEHVINWLKRH